MMISTAYGDLAYSATYLGSITLAAVIALWWGRKHGYPMVSWLLVIMTGGLFFILGEKLGSYSANDWKEVFTAFHFPRTGRKTILGGIVGLLVGLMAGKAWLRFDRPVLDPFAVGLPLGMAVSRIGCLFSGCCFGTPTSLPWGIHYGPESLAYQAQMMHGQAQLFAKTTAAIHPVQVYEIAGCILVALIVYWTRKIWRSGGSLFLFSVLGYSFLRFLMEFFRDPASGFVMVSLHHGLKTIQWVILAAMAVWAILIYIRETMFVRKVQVIQLITARRSGPVWLMIVFLVIAFSGRNWFYTDEYFLMMLYLVPAALLFITRLFSGTISERWQFQKQ